LTQLSGLLSALGPFLRSPHDASHSVLLQEVGPLSQVAQAIKSPSRTPILHTLVAVNAFIQLFVNLSRSCQATYNVSSLYVVGIVAFVLWLSVELYVYGDHWSDLGLLGQFP